MKIGIGVDGYKLPIFDKHLAKHKMEYKKIPLIADEDTFLLTIITVKTPSEMEEIIRAAEKESQTKKQELKRARKKQLGR